MRAPALIAVLIAAVPPAVRAAANECAGGGVHEKHLSKFACSVCHPAGARYGFTTPYVFARGTTTEGGSIALASGSSPTTCTVACHFPMGGAARQIAWTAQGPLACTSCHDVPATLSAAHPAVSAGASRSDCLACHDVSAHAGGTVSLVGHVAGWMDPASASFHAASANRGLANCERCHAQDLGGGVTGVSCGQCHDAKDASGNVVAAWQTICVMCHGGTEDQTGAPPRAIWGQGSDAVRIGAHRAHLAGSALAPPIECAACHVKPADALAAGHIDDIADGSVPVATVTFGGMATHGLAERGLAPAWDRAAATCSNTYCHGATISGGTLKSPVWTSGASQAACGTCHGAPPPSPHPAVDLTTGTKACNSCHSGTVDTNGAVIPPSAGGKHLDGLVEAAGHGAAWMDATSAGFHAYSADSNLAACQACHGANLDGSGGIASTSCASCHDRNLPAGVASWKSNCIMCHGGAENLTGAPPKATWGNGGDPVRVGAHSAHVTGVSNGAALSAAFDCGVCHPKPADALSPGHVDGTTDVAFAGLAGQGTAPAWARGSATCSNIYCHGATLHGGVDTAPSWIGGASEAACGSCHGVPPVFAGHVQNPACGACHPGYTQTSVNAATHVNGTIDLVGLTCTTCHGDPARAATTLNPQLGAAPPADTAGNASSPAVGAHQAHLNDGPLGAAIACTECHAVPSSTAAHPTGSLDLTWGPLATARGATPAYAGGACSSTYCHGATLAGGTNTAPRWTGGAAEVKCGSCHGLPPPDPHPAVSGGVAACNGCHAATVDSAGAILPASAGGKHLNGAVEATGGHAASWMDPASAGFHAVSANRGLAQCQGCHGAALDGVGGSTTVGCRDCHDQNLPAGVASWTRNCVMCHGGVANQSGAPPRATWGNDGDAVRVGAHTAHVAGNAIDCTACHVKPSDALAAGHIDAARATLTWGGLATAGGATPTWNASAATCASTYCHGNYSGTFTYYYYPWDGPPELVEVPYAGSNATPSWTGGPTACGSCHAIRPATGVWHTPTHGNGVAGANDCQTCHPDASSTNGLAPAITNRALHVNGTVEVSPQWWSACYFCH